ncbi:MAG TPA: PIN domain-containing protein [Bryobacteraceae bacterium]|nr:PIN domain-containing protein [Bryobacteraceae bacterium]
MNNFFRVLFLVALGVLGLSIRPFTLSPPLAAAAGVFCGLAILAFDEGLRRLPHTRLLGASLGMLGGLVAAALSSFVLARALEAGSNRTFVLLLAFFLFAYTGFSLGLRRGEALISSPFGAMLPERKVEKADDAAQLNILDTSVIIDGRIADIAETGFLDGVLAIPNFVLRELQLVADSADSLKRNRGRRGLDVLQRLQKMPQLQVRILEDDFPQIKDVDMKLVQLGKLFHAKVVTNDFNLNKVAQLHGVEILNINELANALKPVVLPGETMRVFVLKEGKEYNQGVAYLDDGTMVVVDNARKMISKTIDIAVTSVLQTTAGKMIFGRFDERAHAVYEKQPPAERPTRETGAPAATTLQKGSV